MSIIYNSAVSGVNTPVAITGDIADRPLPATQPQGTIYIAQDTQEIYSQDNGFWRQVASVGGGGGSQDLNQVLAVGDTATNKEINLDDANNTTKLKPDSILIKTISNVINFLVDTGSNAFFRLFYGLSNSDRASAEITLDANKSQFTLIKTLGNVVNFRRFFLLNDSTGNNVCALQESIGGVNANVEIGANIGNAYLQLTDQNFFTTTTISTSTNQPSIRVQNSNTNTDVTIILDNANLPGSPVFLEMPYWTGYIANVNEVIINSNVDLSTGSFPAVVYGVYVITVGDNTNTFDLDNFALNGADGQFVTICAADTPVKCTNTAGNIIGTANINSKGLYKLMKIGNDIYSSHI